MNRVLTFEEVLARPEGAKVWVEPIPGYGHARRYAKLTDWLGCDIALVDEWGEHWRIDTRVPETAYGKLYRAWYLPQPPTAEELAANPWPERWPGKVVPHEAD